MEGKVSPNCGLGNPSNSFIVGFYTIPYCLKTRPKNIDLYHFFRYYISSEVKLWAVLEVFTKEKRKKTKKAKKQNPTRAGQARLLSCFQRLLPKRKKPISQKNSMRRKKDSNYKPRNLKIVVVFLVFVSFLILVSITNKLIILFKQSKFDGEHSFNVEVFLLDKKKAEVISFAPDKSSISILNITMDREERSLSKALEVPMDGYIRFKSSDASSSYDGSGTIVTKIESLFLNYQDLDTQLTIVDLIRLYILSRSVFSNNIITRSISLPKDEYTMDRISSSLFSDYEISQEKISIRIINGTDVFGLGNRLARLITNMGGNVIEVSTAEEPKGTSEVSYFDKKSYTVNRLSKVLGFPPNRKESVDISDVTITIGKDRVGSLVF